MDSNEGHSWDNGIPEDDKKQSKAEKKNNNLPLWGNERTMNLNPLILTNIQSSHYFKVNLYELKTYHEVIDEIYYKVTHLEPWEKGSRKTAGQTGMCGGVRGVGAGGIVSTAYCLLYKLFTLKLTRKQVNGLLTHPDSPYIRGLGFMYIRYTQPPADLWDWYDPYLEDPEEMDVKAGGGQVMTIGEMLRAFLTKLEWFSTLFPRIPVPIQQKLEKKMLERFPPASVQTRPVKPVAPPQPSNKEARHIPDEEVSFGEAERFSKLRRGDATTGREKRRSTEREKSRDGDGRSRDRDRSRDRERSKERSRDWVRDRKRYYSPDRGNRESTFKDSKKSYSQDYSPTGHRDRHQIVKPRSLKESSSHRRRSMDDFQNELRREKDRQRRDKDRERERDKGHHRNRRSRS